MEQITTAPPPQGRFARAPEPAKPPEPATPPAPPAPPADLAAMRTIQRRWPRTLPETRVFPRG